jgi:hypothetical protein
MEKYTVKIDGVDHPVVNPPWTTEGKYSDKMKLQTWANQVVQYPDNYFAKRNYDGLLNKKQNSLSEIAEIKYRIEQERAQKESQQLALNRKTFPPELKEKQLADLKKEKDDEFNFQNVGGKKYKNKNYNKKTNKKRRRHSRRRRTHSQKKRSKY